MCGVVGRVRTLYFCDTFEHVECHLRTYDIAMDLLCVEDLYICTFCMVAVWVADSGFIHRTNAVRE